jgi:hypothetical protein
MGPPPRLNASRMGDHLPGGHHEPIRPSDQYRPRDVRLLTTGTRDATSCNDVRRARLDLGMSERFVAWFDAAKQSLDVGGRET